MRESIYRRLGLDYFYFAEFEFARVVEITQIQNSKCRH